MLQIALAQRQIQVGVEQLRPVAGIFLVGRHQPRRARHQLHQTARAAAALGADIEGRFLADDAEQQRLIDDEAARRLPLRHRKQPDLVALAGRDLQPAGQPQGEAGHIGAVGDGQHRRGTFRLNPGIELAQLHLRQFGHIQLDQRQAALAARLRHQIAEIGGIERRLAPVRRRLDAQRPARQQPVEARREGRRAGQPTRRLSRAALFQMHARGPIGRGSGSPAGNVVIERHHLEITARGIELAQPPGSKTGNPGRHHVAVGRLAHRLGGILQRKIVAVGEVIAGGDLAARKGEGQGIDLARQPLFQKLQRRARRAVTRQRRYLPQHLIGGGVLDQLAGPVADADALRHARAFGTIAVQKALHRGRRRLRASGLTLQRQAMDPAGLRMIGIQLQPTAQLLIGGAIGSRMHVALIEDMPHQRPVVQLSDFTISRFPPPQRLQGEDALVELRIRWPQNGRQTRGLPLESFLERARRQERGFDRQPVKGLRRHRQPDRQKRCEH